MIQRVFFDLGLTLAESDVPQGYVEHLARLGHPVSLEEAQRAYHLANKFFMRERQGALGKGSKEVLRDFLARVCQELGIPQLGEGLFRLTLEDRRPAHWSAFPFSLEVLRGLRERGIATGLVSNWDTSCRSVLEQTGLAPYLDPIVVSSEVGVESRTAASSRGPWNFPGTPRNIASMWGTIITMTAWAPLRWGWSSAFSIPLGSWA